MSDAAPSHLGRNLALGCAALVLVCSGVTCCTPYAGGYALNSGELTLDGVDPSWTVVKGYSGDGKPGAMVIAALRTQCHPMSDGLRVLFNHAWYNAITDGYDLTLTIEGREGSYDEYMLYIWGNNVFLRDETGEGGYVNRVLVCDLNAAGWEALVP